MLRNKAIKFHFISTQYDYIAILEAQQKRDCSINLLSVQLWDDEMVMSSFKINEFANANEQLQK